MTTATEVRDYLALAPLCHEREHGHEDAQRRETETYHPLQSVDGGVLGLEFVLKATDQICRSHFFNKLGEYMCIAALHSSTGLDVVQLGSIIRQIPRRWGTAPMCAYMVGRADGHAMSDDLVADRFQSNLPSSGKTKDAARALPFSSRVRDDLAFPTSSPLYRLCAWFALILPSAASFKTWRIKIVVFGGCGHTWIRSFIR